MGTARVRDGAPEPAPAAIDSAILYCAIRHSTWRRVLDFCGPAMGVIAGHGRLPATRKLQLTRGAGHRPEPSERDPEARLHADSRLAGLKACCNNFPPSLQVGGL